MLPTKKTVVDAFLKLLAMLYCNVFSNRQDYENFLQDLEEDPELRATVNIYKGTFIMEIRR